MLLYIRFTLTERPSANWDNRLGGSMYNRKSLRSYVSYLFYVYSEMGGAVFMLAGAGLELFLGSALGWDHPIAILAWFAAVLFAVIAVCMLWSVYRAEVRS
jgi:hypothetical protein